MIKKTILQGLDLINQGEELINDGKYTLRHALHYINSLEDLYNFFDEVYMLRPNCSVNEFIIRFKKETKEYFPIDIHTVAHYFTDRNYPIFGDEERKRFPTQKELYDSIDLSLSLEENAKKWYGGYCSYYEWSISWLYDIKLNGYDLKSLLAKLLDVILLNPKASEKEIQTKVRSIDRRFKKINEININDFKYEIGFWPKYLRFYSYYSRWDVCYGGHSIKSKFPSSYDLWNKLYLHPDMQKCGFYGEHNINDGRIATLLYYKFNGGVFSTYLLDIVEEYRQSTGKTEIPYIEIDDYLQKVHGFKFSSSPSAFVARLKKSSKYSSVGFSKGVIKFTLKS